MNGTNSSDHQSPRRRKKEHDEDPQSPKGKKTEEAPEVNKGEMFDAIYDFCSSSDINGISYLTDEEKSIPEKITWFFIFIVSLVTCVMSIMEVYAKWQSGEVAIVTSPEQVSVWEIPFPAVTICPLNKVRKSEYNYGKMFADRKNLTGEVLKKFWDVSLVCDLHSVKKANADSITDEDVITNMKEVAPNVDDTILDIHWKSNVYNLISDHPFSTQITGEGVCFTFNSFGKNDLYTDAVVASEAYIDHDSTHSGWSAETGYPSDGDSYPDRIAQAGAANSLNIKLHSFTYDRDLSCGDTVSGYKVMLHNPAEVPRVTQQFFLAPINQQVTLAVTPKVESASKELKNLPPKSRNCYFNEEKKLRFYKVYTKNNCNFECLVNVTMIFCDCLPFYAPRDNETNICGFRRSYCQVEARETVLNYENLLKKNKIDEKVKAEPAFQVFEKCDCLPGCASIDYDGATSNTDFIFAEDAFKKTKFAEMNINSNDLETTNLKIFWKDGSFPTTGRSSTFGQTDFLSSVGGLLGLFLGISASSIIGLFYFVVVKLFWGQLIAGGTPDVTTGGGGGFGYGRPPENNYRGF